MIHCNGNNSSLSFIWFKPKAFNSTQFEGMFMYNKLYLIKKTYKN